MENIKVQPVYGMLNLRVERELATSSYEYILKDIKDLKIIIYGSDFIFGSVRA